MENPFRLKKFSDVIIWSLCHNVRGRVASLSGLLHIIDTSSLSEENAKLIEMMRQSVAKADTNIKIMADCHSNSLLLSSLRSQINNNVNGRKKYAS